MKLSRQGEVTNTTIELYPSSYIISVYLKINYLFYASFHAFLGSEAQF
jgi:hypothetical protein